MKKLFFAFIFFMVLNSVFAFSIKSLLSGYDYYSDSLHLAGKITFDNNENESLFFVNMELAFSQSGILKQDLLVFKFNNQAKAKNFYHQIKEYCYSDFFPPLENISPFYALYQIHDTLKENDLKTLFDRDRHTIIGKIKIFDRTDLQISKDNLFQNSIELDFNNISFNKKCSLYNTTIISLDPGNNKTFTYALANKKNNIICLKIPQNLIEFLNDNLSNSLNFYGSISGSPEDYYFNVEQITVN